MSAHPIPALHIRHRHQPGSALLALGLGLMMGQFPVGGAPSGTDKVLSMEPGATYTIQPADWGFHNSFVSLTRVKITTLPTAGTLKVDGSSATAGQFVSVLLNPIATPWTPRETNRFWADISSSADGTKLVAVDGGRFPRGGATGSEQPGAIYLSDDFGVTWRTRGPLAYWDHIRTSADGRRLTAVGDKGSYTSADSGETWTPVTASNLPVGESSTTSADGTKIAVVGENFISVSTDSGATWKKTLDRGVVGGGTGTRVFPLRIAASADFSTLAATMFESVLHPGPQAFISFDYFVYASTDFGNSWTKISEAGKWNSIAISADGQAIAAIDDFPGRIHVAANRSGVWDWTARDALRFWTAITLSGNGSLLAATDAEPGGGPNGPGGGRIYTFSNTAKPIRYTAPPNGTASFTFQVEDSNGNDNLDPSPKTVTINVIPAPKVSGITPAQGGTTGGSRVRITGSNFTGVTSVTIGGSAPKDIQYLNSTTIDATTTAHPPGNALDVVVTTPAGIGIGPGLFTFADSTAPEGHDRTIEVNPGATYRFSAADWGFDHSNRPSSVFARVKLTTLPAAGILKINGGSVTAGQFISVQRGPAGTNWTAREINRAWSSIASSSDGEKLAATVLGDRIYTSSDSGTTWVPRAENRNWQSIASSADGGRLAAAVSPGQIYISADSGATWTARDSERKWRAVVSSTDGRKLAALESLGQIYTSEDFGATWVARETQRNWVSLASSADGSTLAALSDNIYVSRDSGLNWSARTVGEHSWTNGGSTISCSADGAEIAVYGRLYAKTVNFFGQIDLVGGGVELGDVAKSADFGTTWTTLQNATDTRYGRFYLAPGSTPSEFGLYRYDPLSLVTYTTFGTHLIQMYSGLYPDTFAPDYFHRDPLHPDPDPRVDGIPAISQIAASTDGSQIAGIAKGQPIFISTGSMPELSYTAPESGSVSFTFQVEDNGATNRLDLTPNTITFKVVPRTLPPGRTTITRAGNDLTLTVGGLAAGSYRVQYATGLGQTATWNDFVPPAVYTAVSNGSFSHTDVHPPELMRLYRIVVSP